MGVDVIRGDMTERLPFDDETFTCTFCDPPYGLSGEPDMAEVLTHWLAGDKYEHRTNGFMGKGWDSFVPGPNVWREVYRVCKPGAVLLAFGGTRTVDLLSIAIRLAGFEKFDEIDYFHGGLPPRIDWVTGSGFPKGLDLSKAIDREAGAERTETVWRDRYHDGGTRQEQAEGHAQISFGCAANGNAVSLPATPDAATWVGYNVALKPAHEIILCFRKPRSGTYAANALAHGAGALWVDGGRVGATAGNDGGAHSHWSGRSIGFGAGRQSGEETTKVYEQPFGRWPSNLLLDAEAADALGRQSGELRGRGNITPETKSAGRRGVATNMLDGCANDYVMEYPHCRDAGDAARFFQHCSYSEADAWPLRFWYTAKAGRAERAAGLEGREAVRGDECYGDGIGNGPDRIALRNSHPTVKPLALCRYLATLIRPPEAWLNEARLFCPYAGSGSEMIGALLAGWRNVTGIEREAEYADIAEARLAWWQRAYQETDLTDPKKILTAMKRRKPAPMFDMVEAAET